MLRCDYYYESNRWYRNPSFRSLSHMEIAPLMHPFHFYRTTWIIIVFKCKAVSLQNNLYLFHHNLLPLRLAMAGGCRSSLAHFFLSRCSWQVVSAPIGAMTTTKLRRPPIPAYFGMYSCKVGWRTISPTLHSIEFIQIN